MRTFNRYFVHFMGIGAMILLVAVLLLVADGGELSTNFYDCTYFC